MEPILIHLAKSSALLLLFLVSYLIFLRKETFYTSNRLYLIGGILISLFLPFFQLTKTVQTPDALLAYGDFTIVETAAQTELSQFDWMVALPVIYIVGFIYFYIRFAQHLWKIKALKLKSDVILEDDIRHVHAKKQLSPFSFFKNIFYCPEQFDAEELHAILVHEKAHARQHHSIDVLFIQVVCIVFWFNPLVWLYRRYIKQNLEFLADHVALQQVKDKKHYQYLMLRQTVGAEKFAITNPFYNSLIKKRIVMLNQNQSKKMNTLKFLLVIPALALFMMAFNTKTIYEQPTPIEEMAPANLEEGNSVRLVINKDTSNDELDQMKKDLAKDNIDFSYTVARNDDREIIDISMQINAKSEDGGKFSGNYNSNSNEAIKPIMVFIDNESNSISFGNARHKRIEIHEDGDHVNVWSGLDEIGEHEDITIIKSDGAKKIIINGKELSEEEMEDMNIDIEEGNDFIFESDEGKKIKVKRMKKGKGKDKNVFILKDSDDDADIEVISSEGNGFFFVDSDGEGDPLYILDGKEVSKKQFKKLKPENIATIDVRKGKAAAKKYGKKAKNGVIEITTKKN
ncbi:MAG: M56 family metallopeptidase [Allomuricauda sp.]|nr:MAG: M56 family metallopeptidase [Allomuricauda sp.]